MGNTSSKHSERARALVGIAVAIAALAAPGPAEALLFERLPYGEGRWVLLVRDCGVFSVDYDAERKLRCEEWQTGFRVRGSYAARNGRTVRYEGDAAVLDGLLRQNPPAEVWFFSGGGHLQAGVEIGRVLRLHGATVRVPSATRLRGVLQRSDPRREVSCVSSCTVAFMGGLFRFMDDGPTYEVHSASTVSTTLPAATKALIERGDFIGIARQAQISARFRARQLLTHFQNTLLKLVRTPARAERDADFERWAGQDVPPLPYTDSLATLDRQRITSEGLAAAQDIVMRIERAAMGWAIDDLRAVLPALGPRAAPALRMVEAMYDVSIMETASLTRESMLRMGYLTQELDLEPRS